MSKKKKILIIVLAVVIVLGVTIYYIARGGFTDKQRYENCMETCYETLITNSMKVYCSERCMEITDYSPSATEEQEIINEQKKEENINTSPTNTQNNTNRNINKSANINSKTNTNTAKNINSNNFNSTAAIDTSAEFYCEWSWPQKIIYRETKEVVQECTYYRPWCYYADNSYENVGCCEDQEHTDCITLPNL